MTVLGLDTATGMTTVGVVRDGRLLAEISERAAAGHASGLPDLAGRVLFEADCRIEDVDALAVSIGPGSFTGLRVGLSFAKGIAFARGKKLVGVPTMHALAAVAPEGARFVAACLDARKGEVYLAVFDRSGGRLDARGDVRALPPEDAAAAIASASAGQGGIVVGDGAERHQDAFERLRGRGIEVAPFSTIHPRGGCVARLGAVRLAEGEATPAERLMPAYVRASAAERSKESGRFAGGDGTGDPGGSRPGQGTPQADPRPSGRMR